MDPVLDSSLFDGPVLILLYLLAGAGVALLLAIPGGGRRLRRRLAGVAVGALGGLLVTWLIADLLNVFGFVPTPVMRTWMAAVAAGLGLVAVSIWQGPLWQRILAGAVVPLLILTGAAAINVEFGQFRTLRALLAPTTAPPLVLPSPIGSAPGRPSTSPVAVPAAGTVGTVTIPATVSGFPARQGLVYLPPIAMVPNAPALPVLVMLPGQPGSPSDVFTAGRMDVLVNEYAARRGGYAPIVVVPDQLGTPLANPMCVDGPLGNSGSYLTVDVPAWIRANLNVLPDRRAWSIGGFSQGGTCAIQLGAARPDLFGNILDISGELAPSLGTEQATIDGGFRGNRQAYLDATPQRIMARTAPYPDTTALFIVGANDAQFRGYAQTQVAAAKAAGMRTTYLESPGTAHDWGTVGFAIRSALPLIMQRAGLGAK